MNLFMQKKKVKSRGYTCTLMEKKKKQVFSFLEKWPSANMGHSSETLWHSEKTKTKNPFSVIFSLKGVPD